MSPRPTGSVGRPSGRERHVEVGAGDPAEQLFRRRERGQAGWDAVEDGRPALLGALEPVPVGLDVLGRPRLAIGEDMRDGGATSLVTMPSAMSSTSNGSSAVLGCHPGVEDHLEQDVAELLAKVAPVADLDRLDQLVRLLDQVADERLVRLLRVPRTATGRAQTVHHRDEVEQMRAGQVVRAGQQLELGRGAKARQRSARSVPP